MNNTKIEQELLQLIITEPELTPESIRLIIQIIRNDRSTRQRNSTSRNTRKTSKKFLDNKINTRSNRIGNTRSVSFGGSGISRGVGRSGISRGVGRSGIGGCFSGSRINGGLDSSGINRDMGNSGSSGIRGVSFNNSVGTNNNDDIEQMDTSPDNVYSNYFS